MIKRIIVLNGSDTESFPTLFQEASLARDVTSELVETRKCVLAVGYGEDKNSVSIVSNNRVLPMNDTAYFAKRTGKDTYRTYLLSHVLQKQSTIFSDEANFFSDKTADKITMMVVLPLGDVSVPKSILTTAESYIENKKYFDDHIVYPCVLKKSGSRGRSVWKISNKQELEEKLNQNEELTLIQEFVPNDHDLRVFVLDDEVVVAIKRSSSDGFYNNVSKGGKAERVEITEEEKRICVEATKLAKLRIAGVDLVRSDKGPLIFEVNKSPQMNIFNEAAGFDIEKFYSEGIVSEILRRSK